MVAEADEGFEQVTLRAVHQYALSNDGAVLYAHSKGASDPSPLRTKWRQSMTREVVGRWRENLQALDEGNDAVGCHWLFPNQKPFFGGNFWMAHCDYLRTLSEPQTNSRYDAEWWIGGRNPLVLDRLPGWPYEALSGPLEPAAFGC